MKVKDILPDLPQDEMVFIELKDGRKIQYDVPSKIRDYIKGLRVVRQYVHDGVITVVV